MSITTKAPGTLEWNRFLKNHVGPDRLDDTSWEAWKLLIHFRALRSFRQLPYGDLNRKRQEFYQASASNFAEALRALRASTSAFTENNPGCSLVLVRPDMNDETVVDKEMLRKWMAWQPAPPTFQDVVVQTYPEPYVPDDTEVRRVDEPDWRQLNEDHILHFTVDGNAVECAGCGEQPIVNRRFACTVCGDHCQRCWIERFGVFGSSDCRDHDVRILQVSEGQPPPGQPISFSHNGIVEQQTVTRNGRRVTIYRLDYRGYSWREHPDDNWVMAENVEEQTLEDWRRKQNCAKRRRAISRRNEANGVARAPRPRRTRSRAQESTSPAPSAQVTAPTAQVPTLPNLPAAPDSDDAPPPAGPSNDHANTAAPPHDQGASAPSPQ